MRIIANLISLAAATGIAIGSSYVFVPKAYATVAYATGWLPVTDHVQQAAPGLTFDHKLGRMKYAALQLHESRAKLDENRRSIEAKIVDYTHGKQRSERLLEDARQAYRDNPSDTQFVFIGKRYNPETFSVQIESIDQQVRAQTKSLETLAEARIKVDQVWRDVAAKESRLIADRSRLEAAHALWQTQDLLNGLDIQVDFAQYEEVSRRTSYELRTVEELLRDADTLQPTDLGASSSGEGISAAARTILTQRDSHSHYRR